MNITLHSINEIASFGQYQGVTRYRRGECNVIKLQGGSYEGEK